MFDLYNQQILHCDLKPGNILVSQQGHLAIADFGISQVPAVDDDPNKPFDECTFHAYGGTYAYQAPEMLICHSKTDFTCAVDMWSFGVIIYEIYTSKVRPTSGPAVVLVSSDWIPTDIVNVPSGCARLMPTS
jgi:serine/threonine protein kinase